MSRKAKIITIEGIGEVTVKEVSPLAIVLAMKEKNPVAEMRALVCDCISLPPDKAAALYSSEIEQIVDAFLEVNNSFFAVVDKLGLRAALGDLVQEMLLSLVSLFADSYRHVMARMPGIMAGISSSSPLKP